MQSSGGETVLYELPFDTVHKHRDSIIRTS